MVEKKPFWTSASTARGLSSGITVVYSSRKFGICSSRYIPSEYSDLRIKISEDDTASDPDTNLESQATGLKISTSNPNSVTRNQLSGPRIKTSPVGGQHYASKICSGEPRKSTNCPISVREKVIIKQKLNETDKPSEFRLVDGAIYIRKSAVELCDARKADPFCKPVEPARSTSTKPSEQLKPSAIIGQSTATDPVKQAESSDQPESSVLAEIPKVTDPLEEVAPGSKAVQVTNVKECFLCCKTFGCGLKDLLRMCDSDPDAVIKQYEDRNGRRDVKEEEPDEKFVFQMEKTHGSVYGDEKYHYLMVDKSTLLNEKIPDSQEPQDSIAMFKTASKRSARLAVQPSLTERKSSVPLFFHDTVFSETADDIKEPADHQLEEKKIPEDKTASEEKAASEEKTISDEKAAPEEKVTPKEITTEEKVTAEQEESIQSEPTTTVKEGTTSPREDTPYLDEQRKNEISEVMAEVGQHLDDVSRAGASQEDQSRRISVIWDNSLDSESKLVKPAKDTGERRVSAISWGSNIHFGNVKVAAARDPSVIRDETAQRERHHSRRGLTQNSFFENIVKQERKRNEEAARNSRPRGKSLIEPEKGKSKKKWFGLRKKKKQSDSEISDFIRKGAAKRGSIIESVSTDMDEVDSAYLIKEPLKEEDENDNKPSSQRSSIDSYRRRSMPVERPIFEKNREINQYLHNV